jgi:diadenylate cyclase
MTFMQDLWLQVSKMKWSDYLDIILVAVLICRLLPTLRTTGAARIAKLVVLVLAFTWITDLASLNTLNFLLEELLSIGLIAVIVLYQPELRRILDRLSNVKLDKWMGLHHGTPEDVDPVIRQTVMACEVMSREHVGALIVFSRQQPLEEF